MEVDQATREWRRKKHTQHDHELRNKPISQLVPEHSQEEDRQHGRLRQTTATTDQFELHQVQVHSHTAPYEPPFRLHFHFLFVVGVGRQRHRLLLPGEPLQPLGLPADPPRAQHHPGQARPRRDPARHHPAPPHHLQLPPRDPPRRPRRGQALLRHSRGGRVAERALGGAQARGGAPQAPPRLQPQPRLRPDLPPPRRRLPPPPGPAGAVHGVQARRGVPLRRRLRAEADAEGLRAPPAPPLPPQVPQGLRRARPVAGEPLVDPGRHQRRVGPLHLQGLQVPHQPQESQGLLRLQGLLRPQRKGEGPVDRRLRRARLQHRHRAGAAEEGDDTHRARHRGRQRDVRGAHEGARERDDSDEHDELRRAVQQLHRVEGAGADARQHRAPAALLRQHARHRALDARAQQLGAGRRARVRAVRHLPGPAAGGHILARPLLLRRGAAQRDVRAHVRRDRLQEAQVERREEARQGGRDERVVPLGPAGEAHELSENY
ncbi:uncharacterized protein M6B38_416750 [Iris pallida]|uniref:Uncharacterized protein n=1 Tax=Iris pallida TaxID=29817 RepID=A0AAX6FJ87_IRIPA|nr:uncharacterized protein M6B38_416750 [Iris pallida]